MNFLINLKRKIFLSVKIHNRKIINNHKLKSNELIINQPQCGYLYEIIETQSGFRINYKIHK